MSVKLHPDLSYPTIKHPHTSMQSLPTSVSLGRHRSMRGTYHTGTTTTMKDKDGHHRHSFHSSAAQKNGIRATTADSSLHILPVDPLAIARLRTVYSSKVNPLSSTNSSHRTFGVDFSTSTVAGSAPNRRSKKQQQKKAYGRYLGSTNGLQNGINRSNSLNHPSSLINSSNQQQRPSKESQWQQLKMIMAERAADCLAKLGLESNGHQSSTASGQPPINNASTNPPISTSSNSFFNGGNGGGSPSTVNTTVTDSLSSGMGYPAGMWSTYGTSTFSALPIHQQQQQQNTAAVISPPPAKREPLRVLGGSTSPPGTVVSPERLDTSSPSGTAQNGLFNSPHHRRSKSLRERTGVDQRLERLPSGPPPGQKTLPWTVIKGQTPANRGRPVRISDFIEHVKIMSADSDFRFSEEYDDLRFIGCGQSSKSADLTVNRAKNRFTNILPYDHSRVKLKPLDDEDGSDYVNASYIPGFNSRREFIAAQGPLPSTRDHFWRLVWEQGSKAIVALTKCVEKGRDKCHQYWPDNSQRSVLYADIEVALLNESIEFEEFVVRELRLTNLAEPTQPSRTVLMFHYMAWPDFGVPDHPAGIVHFTRLFRDKLPPSSSNKPTIVHCSAGVGRSGTFIALDRLVQHIECGRPIDVFGVVYEMRLERCFMVQNENQYIFIHHCLQYVLENFYPFLLNPSTMKNLAGRGTGPPGSTYSSPSLAALSSGYSTSSTATPTTTKNPNVFFQNGVTTINCSNKEASVGSGSGQTANFLLGGIEPPKIEIQHQNKGYMGDESDEGIAESGF